MKEYLGISDKTLYKLLKIDGFPQFRLGKDYYIPKDDFENWISKSAKTNKRILL